MKGNAVIRDIMKKKGVTQVDLTKMLDYASQSGVSAKLNRDMRISTLAEFAEALGCELIIRDNTSGEEYKITE